MSLSSADPVGLQAGRPPLDRRNPLARRVATAQRYVRDVGGRARGLAAPRRRGRSERTVGAVRERL